jgi:prevent-host-death family protein
MKTVRLSEITGSLSEYAREGRPEPLVVTRRGKPIVAVMPLTKYDDHESVSLATNPKFLAIVERSRASVVEHGTVPLADLERKHGIARKPARRRSRQRS